MDCSLPGSSIHGILQPRILEWVAIPFSRGSFQPKDQTQVSRIVEIFFTIWATWEAQTLAGWVQKQDLYICCLQEAHLRPRVTYIASKWMGEDIPHKWSS